MNEASWLEAFRAFFEKYKKFIGDKKQEIINNAEINPGSPVLVTGDEKQKITEDFDKTVDDVVDKTVTDINEEVGTEAVSGVSLDTISYAKIVGGFFTAAVIERALQRIHGATVARQTEPDRKEAQDKAAKKGIQELEAVSASETGFTGARSAKEHQLSRGITIFRWLHSGSDDPRLNHLAFNGRIFSWDAPPDEDGFPGEAPHCTCIAVPIHDTQNKALTMNKTKKYFNLSNDNGRADIWIKGEIGDVDFFTEEGVIFGEFKALLDDAIACSDKIVLHIDSPGGSAFDGIAIYNLIKQSNADISVRVEGIAASIASIIMLAVPLEKRFISTGAMVMIHDPWSCLCGNSAYMAQEIEALEILSNSLAQIYEERTALSFDEAKAFMNQEKYFSADEAAEYGFATKVASEATADKEAVEQFMLKLKACSLEQRGRISNLLNYADTENNGTDDMLTIEELSAELENLKAKFVGKETELAEATEKLNAVSAESDKRNAENEELNKQVESHAAEIESIKAESLESAKAQIAEATEIRDKAKAKGFEAKGETVTEIMAGVCVEAGMENIESFNAEALGGLFNFVLDRRELDALVDDAFIKENGTSDTEIIFPSKRQRGSK